MSQAPTESIREELLRPATRLVDRVDRMAKGVIAVSGILIIGSVLAIVVFIGAEGLRLLRGNRLLPAAPWEAKALAGGTDEYLELAWVVREDATVEIRPAGGGPPQETIPLPGLEGATVSAVATSLPVSLLAVGTTDGRVGAYEIKFVTEFQGANRVQVPRVLARGVVTVAEGQELRAVAVDRDEEGNLRCAALDAAGRLRLGRFLYEGEEPRALPFELPQPGQELTFAAGRTMLAVGAGTSLHIVGWVDLDAPVASPPITTGEPVTALAFVLGGDSLALGLHSGAVEVRSRVNRQGKLPTWEAIASFAGAAAPVRSISASPRHKNLLALHDDGLVRLLHTTTRRELARASVAGGRAIQFSAKADGALVVGGDRVVVMRLDTPHPEVSVSSLVRKVWYESYPGPTHVWQTSGGTDDVEPKFGLVPLFVGTLKGTFYAMLFSAPLAVAAALYLSSLAPARLRNVIKPSLELMAAVPSVVVGFLAALWLAPLIERNLLTVFLLPFTSVAAVVVTHLVAAPILRARDVRLTMGRELFFVVPALALAFAATLPAASRIEASLFSGDLRQWLFDSWGLRYDQRNCVVVGIALGFAVIPVVFTIAEDAFSSVPPSLTSAALALGSTPWQTALYVVLPAAAPGVFAALMLGFGRALGETMIVLMATGNTPILDLLPFNGMRTMSAAIAVELPEAPAGGTHYRVLFVVGFLLFVVAFMVNTLADVIATRLRRRFGRL